MSKSARRCALTQCASAMCVLAIDVTRVSTLLSFTSVVDSTFGRCSYSRLIRLGDVVKERRHGVRTKTYKHIRSIIEGRWTRSPVHMFQAWWTRHTRTSLGEQDGRTNNILHDVTVLCLGRVATTVWWQDVPRRGNVELHHTP